MAVMLSIQPKWCELIASGKKTIEVRKTKPKIKTPFKCFIYCTKNNKRGISAYESAYLNGNGEVKNGSGKVIGEFVCDKVCEIGVNSDDFGRWWHETIDEDCSEDNMCLTFDEVSDYLGYKHGFGWHISDLVIYDKPKKLSEFGLKRPFQSWGYCEELEGEK